MMIPVMKTRVETVCSYSAKHMRDLIKQIAAQKTTGSLTLHISQGHINGLELRTVKTAEMGSPS